jgi:hypothetical protein
MEKESYRPSDKEFARAEEMMSFEETQLSRMREEGFDAHQERQFAPIDPRAIAEDIALWEFLEGASIEVSKRRDGVFIRGDRSKNIDTTQFRRYGIPVPGCLILPIIDGGEKTNPYRSNAEEERDRIWKLTLLPGNEVWAKKKALERMGFTADRVQDTEEAFEVASAEKPFRDAARTEDMSSEGKKVLDKIGEKRGDRAVSEINEKKGLK